MQIRSVEIRHEGDGTESTGSDTLDNSQQGTFHNSSCSAVSDQLRYEKTMGSFAAAMTELHTELRDKTVECEALYETARNLSNALQESDSLLQERTLECERLMLKMQMVTFVELSDEPDPLTFYEEFECLEPKDEVDDHAIPRRPAAMLVDITGKIGGKKSLMAKPMPESEKKERKVNNLKISKKPTKNAHSCDNDAVVDDRAVRLATIDETHESSSTERLGAAGPVSVDEFEDGICDDEDVDEVTATVDANAKFSSGPRQAHFYDVILERDTAVQTNRKLTRELRYTRAKVKDLKSRLERSTALVQLSYNKTDGKRANQAHQQQPRKPVFAAKVLKNEDLNADSVQIRRRNLPWLRKQGLSVRNHSGSRNECIAFISQDEMLSSNWNKTDSTVAAAAAEEEYLKAVMSDDADRAGGHVPLLVDI